MNQVVDLAKGKRGAKHCVAHAEALALALARAGRLQAARLSSNRARCGKPFTEMPPKEKGAPPEALELSKGWEVQYAAGLALAFSGESSRSEALAGDLEQRVKLTHLTHAPHSVARKALEIVRSHGFTS